MKLSQQAIMTISLVLTKALLEEENVQEMLANLSFIEETDGDLYCINPPTSIKLGNEENADI